jgi:hypothetical protein
LCTRPLRFFTFVKAEGVKITDDETWIEAQSESVTRTAIGADYEVTRLN